MTQEQIDLINKVVWFIPFKNKRNAIRSFLNMIVESINMIYAQNQQITDLTQHSIKQNQQITDLTQHSIKQNQQITDLTQHSIKQNNDIKDSILTYMKNINKETVNYIFSLKKELLELKGNKEKNNKKVIYTCITNRYDNLFVHTYINNDWDYICYTDDKFLINAKIYGNWIIKPLQFDELDNTRNNRWHKMHPHIILKEYDHSIYIDGNIDIKTSYLFECVDKMINDGQTLSIPPHFERNCLYDEAKVLIENKIDDVNIINSQIKKYEDEGFPKQNGLSENSLIYRFHNDSEIISIMEDWWDILKNYSKRDQLGLFYVLWKHNYKMQYLLDTAIKLDTKNFEAFHHDNGIISLEDLYKKGNLAL